MKRVNYKIGNNIISCLEAGDKKNPHVLFLHGIPACAEIWHESMEKVSTKGYYCLAPDLPGYGETEVIEKEYFSLSGSARLINQWLEKEEFGKVWLVAHDLGGAVAQLMMTDNPNLFEKATLSNAGTADTYPVPVISKMVSASKIGLFYWMAIFGRFKSDKLYESMNGFFVRNKSFLKDDFERIFYDGKFHRKDAVSKFQKMLSKLDNQDTVENMTHLKNVKIPVHLIWAMNDRFQSWEKSGRILENSFSHVRISKINECGHYLQLDANEEYIKELLSF